MNSNKIYWNRRMKKGKKNLLCTQTDFELCANHQILNENQSFSSIQRDKSNKFV